MSYDARRAYLELCRELISRGESQARRLSTGCRGLHKLRKATAYLEEHGETLTIDQLSRLSTELQTHCHDIHHAWRKEYVTA